MSNANQATQVAMSNEQIMAELQRLQAENNALRASRPTAPKKDTVKLIDGLACRVSEKGAISIYGLGRFPLTLYRHQFERLVPSIPLIQAFIAENTSKLTVKPSVVK